MQRTGVVLYPFVAQRPKELALVPGQRVTLLKSSEAGWVQGRTADGKGWFPAGYVQVDGEEGESGASAAVGAQQVAQPPGVDPGSCPPSPHPQSEVASHTAAAGSSSDNSRAWGEAAGQPPHSDTPTGPHAHPQTLPAAKDNTPAAPTDVSSYSNHPQPGNGGYDYSTSNNYNYNEHHSHNGYNDYNNYNNYNYDYTNYDCNQPASGPNAPMDAPGADDPCGGHILPGSTSHPAGGVYGAHPHHSAHRTMGHMPDSAPPPGHWDGYEPLPLDAYQEGGWEQAQAQFMFDPQQQQSYDHDSALVDERNADLAALQGDVHDIHRMHAEQNELLARQHEGLQQAEVQTASAEDKANRGVYELAKAKKVSKNSYVVKGAAVGGAIGAAGLFLGPVGVATIAAGAAVGGATGRLLGNRTQTRTDRDLCNYQKGVKWQSDSSATHCTKCQVKFTPVKRKHHCRVCGRIFCSDCCSEKLHVRNDRVDYGRNVRVCNSCYLDVRQQRPPAVPTSSSDHAPPPGRERSPYAPPPGRERSPYAPPPGRLPHTQPPAGQSSSPQPPYAPAGRTSPHPPAHQFAPPPGRLSPQPAVHQYAPPPSHSSPSSYALPPDRLSPHQYAPPPA